jgi:hypothetical protein
MPNRTYPLLGIKEYIKNVGTPAVWIDFVEDGENDHGDTIWQETHRHINVVQSFQTSTKVPVKVNMEIGQFTSYDFEFFTTDILDVDIPVVGKRPELLHRGRRHLIDETETVPIGVMRFVTSELRV